jgi:hypothetical protein
VLPVLGAGIGLTSLAAVLVGTALLVAQRLDQTVGADLPAASRAKRGRVEWPRSRRQPWAAEGISRTCQPGEAASRLWVASPRGAFAKLDRRKVYPVAVRCDQSWLAPPLPGQVRGLRLVECGPYTGLLARPGGSTSAPETAEQADVRRVRPESHAAGPPLQPPRTATKYIFISARRHLRPARRHRKEGHVLRPSPPAPPIGGRS